MTMLMAHSNPAKLENGQFRVDRKFLVGMQRYAEQIREPLLTVHPELAEAGHIMDAVEVPCSQLPYRVMTVKVDGWGRALPSDIPRLREELAKSTLVYGGGLGTPELARELNVPYILILEYDLRTQIVATASRTSNPMRRASRAIRTTWHHLTTNVPDMRKAHSLHCNGYPVYDAARRHNRERLLYLDSRMSEEMLIAPERLAARLASRTGRPLRLLYSGRYERMKGADEAVRVGVECLRQGLDIEMHFYGQGALHAELKRIAAAGPPERIQIHDSIPYPELVKVSQTFDVFVCCHIQSDPSCTYLESFGAGLPIVGYGNRMWQRLCQHSGAGFVAPLGHVEKVADDIRRLISDQAALSEISYKALAFAQQHCYEREFAKRIAALNAAAA